MNPRTTIQVIGNVTTIFFILSPIPTVVRSIGKKTTEAFHQYNYFTGTFCYACIAGISLANSSHTLVILPIALMGSLLNILYLAGEINHESFYIRMTRCLLGLMGIFCLPCGALVLIHIYFHGMAFIGLIIMAYIYIVSVYVMPLAAVSHVLKTKSVEYLSFWVALAGFVNACVWIVCALMPPSVNLVQLAIYVTGALSSVFQLLIHARLKLDGVEDTTLSNVV